MSSFVIRLWSSTKIGGNGRGSDDAHYRVGGVGVRTAATTALTPIGTPALITGLSSTGSAPSVTINWTAATSTTANPVTNMEVLKDGVVVATLSASATTHNFTDLSSGAGAGTTYVFAVRAKNALSTAASTSLTVNLYDATATANYVCSGGGTYNGTGTAGGSCGSYDTGQTITNPANLACRNAGGSFGDCYYLRTHVYADYPSATVSSYTYSCPAGGVLVTQQCRKDT